MEYSVEFVNDQGKKLRGIMHSPVNPATKSLGAIILNAGLEDRVGVHRLNLKIARELSGKGHYVLRFDTQGIGFSEGELESGSNVDCFLRIQNGIFLGDALASINFLSKEVKVDKIVLIGLCGGAVTALAAASRDKRIETVILIDCPAHLDKNESEIKSFYTLSTLKKAFLGQLDVFGLTKLVFKRIKCYARKIIQGRRDDDNPNIIDHSIIGHPINKKFVQDFLCYISSKRKILFIMAESSLVGYEFEYQFKNEYLSKAPASLYKIVYISEANHAFHSLSSQAMLLSEISGWMTGCGNCRQNVPS